LRVLAIDTTTALGSVALVEDDVVLAESRFRALDRHSARLIPAVEGVLALAGLRPAEIEGFAVATGPGPFTGIRVGVSTTQGLALASGRPAVGVSTLDVLAARIRGEGPHLVPVIDAGRGQVYACLHDAAGRRVRDPSVETPGAMGEWLPEDPVLVGDGAALYAAEIARLRPGSRFPRRSLFLAASLGRLAVARFAEGEGGPPERLRVLYLRGADIRKAAPAV
jgi:tRNA threonylcarbamoyladenosine biosynthesis protein TsaB